MSDSIETTSTTSEQTEACGIDDRSDANSSGTETFSIYLAKRFVGEKRFRPGVPEEATKLVEHSDVVLSYADFGLSMVCIADRESNGKKKFLFSQQELMDIGRSCLKYTGTVNGAKMPVGIRLYEVGDGPPSTEDRARLTALHKAGLSKVAITCFHLDTRNNTVWSSAPFNG